MKNIIEILNWRYATKKFDATKKISEADFDTILEALRLSPSSFWLQPWKFFVIENEELRKKLQEASFWQPQITEASHLIVFAIPLIVDSKYIDSFVDSVAKTRWVNKSTLAQYDKMMKNYILPLSKEWNQNNSALQAYVALWNVLTVSATMWIDTCPIWGIEANQYDEILWIREKWWKTSVVCVFWYRAEDDKYAELPKVRFCKEQIIEVL